VDTATLETLERWRDEGPFANADQAERAAAEQLHAHGFLVADDAEDDQRVRGFLERAAEGVPGAMYVTLMPTLACNLACTYCFQKEHPAFERMKPDTEAATVEWILRKVDAAASRKLVVHYFGGEPLTRKDLLLRTAEIFSTSMAARGAQFEWEITTNGLGLEVDFVRALARFGRGAIKVTLDGDAETHDAARVYRSGKGSFAAIFERTRRIALECPEVRLRIGGNFRAEDGPSYERLLDRMEAAGLAGRLDQVRFKPVIDTARDSGGTCTSCASIEADSRLDQQLAASVARRGLSRAPVRKTPSGPCQLHWKHSYVIDPEGLVYKCPAVAGRPELAVGSVQRPRALEKVAPLLELRPWEQCGACPYLPVCVGGCLGGKYLETGRKDQVFCRKPQFERAFRDEVTARYRAEFGPPGPSAADACASPSAGVGPD
jgi:uncharacterized protein